MPEITARKLKMIICNNPLEISIMMPENHIKLVLLPLVYRDRALKILKIGKSEVFITPHKRPKNENEVNF